MNKYILLLLFISFPVLASEPVCWAKYEFSEGVIPKGMYGGSGSSVNLEYTPKEVVYAWCKHQCNKSVPEHEKVVGVQSCTLDDIPIEDSKYLDLYESSISKICKVQVVGQYTHDMFIAENESECRDYMNNYVMCEINDNKCIYIYGYAPYGYWVSVVTWFKELLYF